jgi:putative FmdB family regulatory protein
MPLYEYTCRGCRKRFEALVFGKEQPACPKCKSRDLEKLFSTFAVSGAERKSDSDLGGDFGGGSDFGDGSDLGGSADLGGGSEFGDGDDLGGTPGPGGPGFGDID